MLKKRGETLFGECIYSTQKKKVNGPEGANFVPLLMGVYYFWHHCIMVGVLPYKYNFGKKNCLTIVGKNLFAPPGPLTFFFNLCIHYNVCVCIKFHGTSICLSNNSFLRCISIKKNLLQTLVYRVFSRI